MTHLTRFSVFISRVLRAKPMLTAMVLSGLCFPPDLPGQLGGRPAMDPVRLQQKLVGRVGKRVKLTEIDGSSETGVLVSYDQDSVDILLPSANQLHLMDARIAKVGDTNHLYPVIIAGVVILAVVAYAKGGVY